MLISKNETKRSTMETSPSRSLSKKNHYPTLTFKWNQIQHFHHPSKTQLIKNWDTPLTTIIMTSSSLHLLPLTYSDHAPQKPRSVLPIFGFINMTISSVVTIYRAHNNNDTPTVVFVGFVYFGSFLLDYCFRLYHSLPKSSSSNSHNIRRNVKIIIWVLISTIMLGFACEFSTFMSFLESSFFFGLVISGNIFLFYVYFIWEGDKSATTSACSNNDTCCYNDYDYKPILTEAKVDV